MKVLETVIDAKNHGSRLTKEELQKLISKPPPDYEELEEEQLWLRKLEQEQLELWLEELEEERQELEEEKLWLRELEQEQLEIWLSLSKKIHLRKKSI